MAETMHYARTWTRNLTRREYRVPKIKSEPVLETCIATRRLDLTRAYALVYERYVESGFIPAHPSGMVYQRPFGLPTSRTIVTKGARQEVLGTVTLVGDNAFGLNIELTYPDEVDQLRDQGRHLAEITCLAIDSRRTVPGTATFFALTQFMFQYADWCAYDDLIIAVHPRHVPFYERCFRVVQFGPCRPHKLVSGKPAIACRIDMHVVKQLVRDEVLKWYLSSSIPTSKFTLPAISTPDHRHFCETVGLASAYENENAKHAA